MSENLLRPDDPRLLRGMAFGCGFETTLVLSVIMRANTGNALRLTDIFGFRAAR